MQDFESLANETLHEVGRDWVILSDYVIVNRNTTSAEVCSFKSSLVEGSLLMLAAGPVILLAQVIMVVSYTVVAEIAWRLRKFQTKTTLVAGGQKRNESVAGYRKRTMTTAGGSSVVRKRTVTTAAGPAVELALQIGSSSATSGEDDDWTSSTDLEEGNGFDAFEDHADDELLDDPNAQLSDPVRRMTVVQNKTPPVLFEGWFHKKRMSKGSNLLSSAFAAVPSFQGRLGWSRRYLRVFPGKLEWYKDDDTLSFECPMGFAPLAVLEISSPAKDYSWRTICTSKVTTDASCPASHRQSLVVTFAEHGETTYRLGLGAHHERYSFAPELEADVEALRDALNAAMKAVSYWSEDVCKAAAEAGKVLPTKGPKTSFHPRTDPRMVLHLERRLARSP